MIEPCFRNLLALLLADGLMAFPPVTIILLEWWASPARLAGPGWRPGE